MNKHIGIMAIGVALTLGSGVATAQDLGSLGKMIPGVSGLSSGSMGNVAGLLQYCVTNNFLGGDSGASGISQQLLGKLGGGSGEDADSGSSTTDMLGKLTGHTSDAPADTSADDSGKNQDYLNGAKGLLMGDDGKSTDLTSLGGGSSDLKSQLTKQVCDTVLKQGKSFLGM